MSDRTEAGQAQLLLELTTTAHQLARWPRRSSRAARPAGALRRGLVDGGIDGHGVLSREGRRHALWTVSRLRGGCGLAQPT